MLVPDTLQLHCIASVVTAQLLHHAPWHFICSGVWHGIDLCLSQLHIINFVGLDLSYVLTLLHYWPVKEVKVLAVHFILFNVGNVEILKLIYLKNKKYLHALAADGELPLYIHNCIIMYASNTVMHYSLS